MSPELDRRGCTIRVGAIATVLAALIAHRERSSLISESGTVPSPGADLGVATLEGSVDAAAGAASLGPASPATSLVPGSSAVIYGDRNATVRLLSSPIKIDGTSGSAPRTRSLRVGVRNCLDYPGGRSQGGEQLTATRGTHVVMVAPPVLTSTSSGSRTGGNRDVAIANGVRSFTWPGQSYCYRADRLAAKQLVASGEARGMRRLWKLTSSIANTTRSYITHNLGATQP